MIMITIKITIKINYYYNNSRPIRPDDGGNVV